MAIEAYHNNTSSEHQDRFNTLSGQGFRIISLSVYGSSSDPRFAAVWSNAPGPAWHGVHNLSGPSYQVTFGLMKQRGFQNTIISAAGSGSDAVFAGVFVQNKISQTEVRFGLTGAQFRDKNSEILTRNLSWMVSYGTGSDSRYAAIWVPGNENTVSSWVPDINANDYQRAFNDKVNGVESQLGVPTSVQKMIPVGVYVNTAEALYGGIFHWANPWGSWVAVHGLSSQNYQNKFNDLKAAGFHPVRVAGGAGEDDDIRFSAIFAKP